MKPYTHHQKKQPGSVFFRLEFILLMTIGSLVLFGMPSARAHRQVVQVPPLVLIQVPSPAPSLVAFDQSRVMVETHLSLTAEEVTPLALTIAEVDGDGLADLIVANGQGHQGQLQIHRGNPAFHLLSPPATQSQTIAEEPFFATSELLAQLPEPTPLIGTGDFNGDGLTDIAAAAQDGQTIYVLAGTGPHTMPKLTTVEPGGSVTSLTFGDLNRRDGLTDVVATVETETGPVALVFESPYGAFSTEPERFALPSRATSTAIGQLNQDGFADLAIAAGTQVILIEGRDRKLSLDEQQRSTVKAARTTVLDLGEPLSSVVAGKFIPTAPETLMVLTQSGKVLKLQPRPGDRSLKSPTIRPWSTSPVSVTSPATRLLVTHTSGLSGDELLILDAHHRLSLIYPMPPQSNEDSVQVAVFDLTMPVVDILPMRLNADGLADWVILDAAGRISKLVTLPAATLVVTNTGDNGGVNPAVGAGTGTLRQAIVDANATPAADTIIFNLPGTPFSVRTITVSRQLPSITQPVTIDGWSQGVADGTPGYSGAPLIEIDGSATIREIGLLMLASNSVVRGLTINRFPSGSDGGNGIGIYIGPSTQNVRVQGCRIGTAPDGVTGAGNEQLGVWIEGPTSDHIIGTDGDGLGDTSEGNLISANGVDGIRTNNATNITIAGNLIGTDVTGTADLGNGFQGIALYDSTSTEIGGTTPVKRNVISGNNTHGLHIERGISDRVEGNLIGISLSGTADLGNDSIGITTVNSTLTTIGGTTSAHRNIVSGNNVAGIRVSDGGTNVLIQGNWVGLNAAGTAAIGNSVFGINLQNGSTGNMIGGLTLTPGTPPGNVVSGNGNISNGGILILSNCSNNQVLGNIVGLTPAGTMATGFGNTGAGVYVSSTVAGQTTQNNTIGGSSAQARNIISGNTFGIRVQPLSGAIVTETEILGNYIGTDLTGTIDCGNTSEGIGIGSASNTRIGGATTTLGAPPGNLISGNGASGIFVTGETTEGTIINGNIIGLDASGNNVLRNAASGISVQGGADATTIGGSGANDGNLISGNGADGISPSNTTTTGISIQGNLIGTDITGTLDRGNLIHGIDLNGCPDALIGGNAVQPGTGAGNVISGNNQGGVVVRAISGTRTGATIRNNLITGNGTSGVTVLGSTNNRITENSIFANRNLGISHSGTVLVNANDPGDTDTGANRLQNFPVLTTAFADGGTTYISGNLNSTPGRSFLIEFFTNPDCDASGHGEGQTLIGTTTVTTNGSGDVSFSASLPVSTTRGEVVTATATDQTTGDTSEFSACQTITARPPTFTKTFGPDQIFIGGTSVLTFTLSNPNSVTGLSNIHFTDLLPAGLVVAGSPTVTGTCSGTITANPFETMISYAGGSLAPGASCSFSVRVQALTSGTKTNITGPVSTTESGTGSTATDTLTVEETVHLALLLVADTLNHRIQRFDGQTWVAIGTLGTAPGQFRLPEAVTSDPIGQRLYVADTGNNRIQWSTDGGASWQLFASLGSAPNQVRAPQGLALDSVGNLYVADTGNGRVLRFAQAEPGSGVVIATNGAASGQVGSPRGLVIDQHFNLYVTDESNSRILKIANAHTVTTATSGAVIALAGLALNRVQKPQGIALDDEGNLYLADTGNSRILRWANANPNQATALALVGPQLGQVNAPEGVTISRFASGPFAGQSVLVIADTGNHRLESRLIAGGPWSLVGSPNGSGPGQFRAPSKIR